jgi:hypothetical protein
MSLVQHAVRGDYEALLKALYLNPFISHAEKVDALW